MSLSSVGEEGGKEREDVVVGGGMRDSIEAQLLLNGDLPQVILIAIIVPNRLVLVGDILRDD